MEIIKTKFNPQIPLQKIEEFIENVIGWEKGCYDVMLVMFSDREQFVFIDYPTDLNSELASNILGVFAGEIEIFNKENELHPAVKGDTLVNGGALKLALNTLTRSGKHEIAIELEKTISRS